MATPLHEHEDDYLIISAVHNVPWWRRLLGWLVTLAFWCVWFYLWLPLLVSLARLGGMRVPVPGWVRGIGWVHSRHLLILYALAAALIGGALLLWAAINLWRFAGVDRRGQIPAVAEREVAQALGIAETELARGRRSKVCIARHQDDGWLESVEVVQPLPPPMASVPEPPPRVG
ncbi:poly-beta-1,6-N-acetyl-D-glucosamine biosynthesis protein PgaD [Chromobacterium violaceum]|uniref:Poly-beta-1,6-N-acetyl-D-glucosamine biosynthesis protein PgaD n=1 Tax=Chromobacterium violaceum TaxID=536 RepID=A0A202BEH9_CHRVL|nr:poly-beta-1,6-N-acetyl-D-glucosamine biosynthesis protein PgaD [Chromobacterium violaceum]MBT2868182.1 poly-beta-1,6-N-acetyl-D-glucosamine biosynthesis protein PgaD [Chromobacterium violaceum]OVE49775.1 poly-beta-1,6-N-acetyl-D-glucosamine biosynthesis protein PgaD [Chromobacterium violaceum]